MGVPLPALPPPAPLSRRPACRRPMLVDLCLRRRSSTRGTGTLPGARTWPAAMPGAGRAGASQVCSMHGKLKSIKKF